MGLNIWSNRDSSYTAALPMEVNFQTTSHTLVRCGKGKKELYLHFHPFSLTLHKPSHENWTKFILTGGGGEWLHFCN